MKIDPRVDYIMGHRPPVLGGECTYCLHAPPLHEPTCATLAEDREPFDPERQGDAIKEDGSIEPFIVGKPFSSEMVCRRCGGEVIEVLLRAWCIRPYASGGCGSFWARWRSDA